MENSFAAASRNGPKPSQAATTGDADGSNTRYRLDNEYSAVPNTEDKRDAMSIAEESKQPAAPTSAAPALIHESGPHIVEKTLFDKDKAKTTTGGTRTQLISTNNKSNDHQ